MKVKFGKFTHVCSDGSESEAYVYANGERVGEIWRYMLRKPYDSRALRLVSSYYVRLWADDVGNNDPEFEETVRYSTHGQWQTPAQAKRALKRRIAEHLIAREAQESVDANEPIEAYLLRTC